MNGNSYSCSLLHQIGSLCITSPTTYIERSHMSVRPIAYQTREDNRFEDDFDNHFRGIFAPETDQLFAGMAEDKKELITGGYIYKLIQEDKGRVQVILTGPTMVDTRIACRRSGFHVASRGFAKNEDGTPGVEQWFYTQPNIRIRSIIVPIGTSGYGIKFKWVSDRGAMVVC